LLFTRTSHQNAGEGARATLEARRTGLASVSNLSQLLWLTGIRGEQAARAPKARIQDARTPTGLLAERQIRRCWVKQG